MSNVFLTGDRTFSPVYVPLVSIEMLRAVNAGDTLLTGENSGVEQLVRDIAERAGIAVEVVPGGKPEFDMRHANVAASGASAVVVHSDPHASSLYPSLLKAFADADRSDDDVRLVTHADLMV